MESALFGSTGNASHVAFAINNHDSAEPSRWSDLAQALPWPASLRHVPRGQFDPRGGLNYLGFSLKGGGARAARACIKDQTSFEIKIIPRYPVASISDLELALASLWLLVFLGGFGSRSRRGFGAMRVVQDEPEKSEVPPFVFKGKTPQELQSFLDKGLEDSNRVFLRQANGTSVATAERKPDFCVLSRYRSDLVLQSKWGQGWRSWHEALGEGCG